MKSFSFKKSLKFINFYVIIVELLQTYKKDDMTIIILCIAAYLIGAIPAGLWIGKIFFKKDLHEYGSGNTGTTNTFRILGKRAGIIVFIFDLLKGTLATLLPLIFHVHGVSPLIFG